MAARGKKAAPKKQLLPLISSPGEQGAGEKSLFALKPANLLDSTSRAPTIEGMKLKVQHMFTNAEELLKQGNSDLKRAASDAEAKVHKRAKTDHAAACQLLADCEAMVAGAKEVHDKIMDGLASSKDDLAGQSDKAHSTCMVGLKGILAAFEQQVHALGKRHNISA